MTSTRFYSLWAEYDGLPGVEAIYSTSEAVLRQMGRDHHAAAIHKPDLRLLDPEGKIIATMDTWASDWKNVEV